MAKAKRNAHDRAFFNIHGHWPEEDFDAKPAFEVEEDRVELRREIPAGPGITMAQVVRLRPARGLPKIPLWQQVCAMPAVAIFGLALIVASVAVIFAAYIGLVSFLTT